MNKGDFSPLFMHTLNITAETDNRLIKYLNMLRVI